MSRGRFTAVRALFEEARALGHDERRALLDERCGDDTELRREVESLLDQDGEWDVLQTSGVAGGADALLRDIDASERPVDVPGYDVVRVVGEGGMGTVYEAEQRTPQRRVALKVLRSTVVSRAMLRRFRHESEVLGRLQHPGIAQVYEAGTYGSGQPFFAMEFVEGTSLTRHAESLSTEAQVGLLIQVCEAVEHAHQKGVIHRDLKPSNILVDRDGRPRVLDFGVARSMDTDVQVTTMQTAAGELVGTLAYMSPEQLSGDPSAIDTRADVYALGVIAYEILGGSLPHELQGMSLPQAVVALRDAEPVPLGSISRVHRGDLSTVVSKALEKDPERRYQSATALGADLHRFLSSEPILARPPSTVYQLRKFASRNRALVAGVIAVFVVLLLGMAGTSTALAWALIAEAEASESAELAEREAAIAEAVNDFLNDGLLRGVDPARTADRDITMREVLDLAAENIEGRFPDQPLVEVRIRDTLAKMYDRLGQAESAEPHYRRAYQLLLDIEGPEYDGTITAIHSLSTNMMQQGRFEEAIELIEIELDVMRGTRPEDDEQMLKAVSGLAVAYLQTGRLGEAAPLLEESLVAKRRVLGDKDPSTLTSINNLAGLYIALGEPERGLPLYEEAYRGRSEVLGEDDPATLSVASAYAWGLSEVGRHEEARELLEPAIERMRERLDRGHPILLRAISSLGTNAAASGDYEEAERWCREVYERRLESLGDKHISTFNALLNLAQVVSDGGHPEDALEFYGTAFAMEEGAVTPGHWVQGSLRIGYGVALTRLERYDEAEPHLRQGVCMTLDSVGLDHDRTVGAVGALAAWADAIGDGAHAVELRGAATEEVLRATACGGSDG